MNLLAEHVIKQDNLIPQNLKVSIEALEVAYSWSDKIDDIINQFELESGAIIKVSSIPSKSEGGYIISQPFG